MKRSILLGAAILLAGVAVVLLLRGAFEKAPRPDAGPPPAPADGGEKIDLSHFSPDFRFAAGIPEEWKVYFSPEKNAIGIYDPVAEGTAIEKSQIWITRFSAERFLTLPSVTITRNDPGEVRGHEARIYEIEKKPEAADVAGEPSWRNGKHTAYDIRFAETGRTFFYPIAFKPGLPQEAVDAFLGSLRFHNDAESFSMPLLRLGAREVRKAFGRFVTPENSPVSPEFFAGYHTGIDYEILPGEEGQEVRVFALCGGRLRQARAASGYGGVAVQECLLGDEPATVIYGHLAANRFAAPIGSYLAPGDAIGVLGGAGAEAGGGRKHLHLGIHRGASIDIRGYVQSESELSAWLDPNPYGPE